MDGSRILLEARNSSRFQKPLQFCTRHSIRRVDHDPDIGIAGNLQGGMLEFQVAQGWMLHSFVAIERATRIVMGPPATKFRADPFQILNQLLEPSIAGIASVGGAKFR